MPTVKIHGQVRHQSPLGPPCQNAQVKIYDADQGGNGRDLILTKTTDANGVFKGTSSNWQDRNTIRVSTPFGRMTQQLPDLLVLQVEVKQGSKKLGPLPYLQPPGNLIAPPILVPWASPETYVAKVGNKKCKDGFALQKAARAAFESGIPKVKITIYGPSAVIFMPLAGSLNSLKNKVNALLPGAKDMLYVNPTGAEELLAIAVVILAIGAAASVGIVATGVAFALILALVLGYKSIKVKMIPGGSTQQPLPSIEFSVEK